MTFWSGDKLAQLGRSIGLVDDFDEKKIDCSAYTLTLGPECFVTPSFSDSQPHLKQKLADKRIHMIGGQQRVEKGGELVIPPGQFAFLLTEETIHIPDYAMGFISLKSFAKWKGLINVSGFHADPGYHGRLIYSVFNAGPSSIHLCRGDDLFLLWIADLDQSSSVGYRKVTFGMTDISSKLISDIDRPLHSLQSLSEKVEKLQADLKLLYRVLAVLAVIGGLFFAAWALLPARNEASRGGAQVEAIS